MNHSEYLQNGLLSWFRFSPNELKSFDAIKGMCQRICKRYSSFEEISDIIYVTLYPLIRRGIIESYGDGKFGLSPTSILYNQHFLLTCNVPEKILLKVDQSSVIEPISGIKVYTYSNRALSEFVNEGIPANRFDLESILLIIQPLQQIIGEWEEEDAESDTGELWYWSEKDRWINNGDKAEYGVFRKNNRYFNEKVLKINTRQWKRIPGSHDNIDAFRLAILFCRIKNKYDIGLNYTRDKNILSINNNYFPLSLERLLYINSLLSDPAATTSFDKKYIISPESVKILNNLLARRINML